METTGRSVDGQLGLMEGLVEQMDKRITQVEQGLINLGNKMDKHFHWMVGIQVTILVTIITILIGVVWKLAD